MSRMARHSEALSGDLEVMEVPAEVTHDLRRRVLRAHLPAAEVVYPADDAPGSFHLALRAGPRTLGIASFSLEPVPEGEGDGPAARLRGMAVEPTYQRRGLGRLLLREAVQRLARDGVRACWANARVSALPFYEALGFAVRSEEFESVGLPHRVVVLPLAPAPRHPLSPGGG